MGEHPINDGGPAFPVPIEDFRDLAKHPATGMTLRDWFAGQALVGMLAHPGDTTYPAALANNAYALADAMLAERAKGADRG